MSVDESLADLARELFAAAGAVSIRRMFGGAGLFSDGVMFGLIADGTIFLKTDQQTESAFRAEGSEPFAYEARGRTVALSYWRMPERLFDEPDEAAGWARAAMRVARAAAQKKPAGAGTRKKRAPS